MPVAMIPKVLIGVRGLPMCGLDHSEKGNGTGGFAHGVHPGADVGNAEHDPFSEAVDTGPLPLVRQS
ncbi:hypothetical protein ODZ83_09565 [Acaricomes phytoseiuli]|uniref:hypothetical protein n=1 Tax=Acaricomes phytoseiuli TaxID=291968 RepID=UPI00036280CB|nr:hypothetical protein [Acaricomes phytoseiuli]MCW1250421.1 hypothetical protein [Acaricomes phytoseiuli]